MSSFTGVRSQNNQKSVGLAIILTIFFGPFGMLYSTVSGAIIMFLVQIALVFVIIATFGLGLGGEIIVWPLQVIWAATAANRKNNWRKR